MSIIGLMLLDSCLLWIPSIPVCGDAFHVYGETCDTFILVYDLSMKKCDSFSLIVRVLNVKGWWMHFPYCILWMQSLLYVVMYSSYDCVLLKIWSIWWCMPTVVILAFLFRGSRNRTYFSGGWIIMETTAKGYYVYSKN